MNTKERLKSCDNKTLCCIWVGLHLLSRDTKREKSRDFWKELYQEAEAELESRDIESAYNKLLEDK